MIDVNMLKMLPLFDTLVEEHLGVLTKNLRPLHMDAGEMLITEQSQTRRCSSSKTVSSRSRARTARA